MPPARFRQFILTFAALLLAIPLLLLAQDLARGGTGFRQGDWLINMAGGPVRRGIGGEALLWLADRSGLSAASWAVGVALGLYLPLAAVLWASLARLLRAGCDTGGNTGGGGDGGAWLRTVAALVFLPCFVLSYWALDPPGSLRKEVIGLCAMAVLLMVPLGWLRARVAGPLAVALMLCGAALHEVNALLVPAFGAVGWAALRPDLRRPAMRAAVAVAAGALGLGAAGSLLFAALHSQTDPAQVCAPLLERGLSDDLCGGAIGWLDKSRADAMADLQRRFQGKAGWTEPLTLALSLTQIGYFLTRFVQWRPLALIGAVLALPMLALGAMALDWGRWLALVIDPLLLVWIARALRGEITLRAAIPRRLFWALFVLNMLFPPHHAVGIRDGGLLRTLSSLHQLGG